MFHCLRRAVPLLKANGGGAIVNLSSAAGKFGFPLRTPYAATKFGVIGLTETLWRSNWARTTFGSMPSCPAWWRGRARIAR